MKQGKVIMLMLILCCIVNSACSKKPVYEGVVVRKWSDHTHMILVINKISDEILENGSEEEIMELAYQEGNGMIFYVSERKFKDLKVGQKVSISYNGKAQESLPPKTGAERIEVLENEEKRDK